MFSSNGTQVAADNAFIEDLFSTFLYTGNGSTKTITNGIDLSTKGGLVWLKDRSSGQSHTLSDTARGVGTSKQLRSNTTGAATTDTFTGFTTTGFTLDASFGSGAQNLNAVTYASWTFRKQKKFFDIVTYTGDGVTGKTINHNLGSVPGCIIVKRTDTTGSWIVYHRSSGTNPENRFFYLNATYAVSDGNYSYWYSTVPTDTYFKINADTNVNANGSTYIAYLFAHDAGGFGLAGTDNAISCGSFTSTGQVVNLGYEPQWLLAKKTSGTSDWLMFDNMRIGTNGRAWRNFNGGGDETPWLAANLSDTETIGNNYGYPTATGFYEQNFGGGNWIYIAIRRGPMRVPTLGTSVYNEILRTGTSANVSVTGVGFPPDLVIGKRRAAADEPIWFDRLRGATKSLYSSDTSSEATDALNLTFFDMDGFSLGTDNSSGKINFNGRTYVNWAMRRAPSFFDIVSYTPSTTADLIYHNLGVVPEMIIAKNRGATATQWYINHAAMGATNELYFTTDAAQPGGTWTKTSTYWNNSSALYPTGQAHVAYLFATCPGVSKVGSYTGTATTKQIDCGFTGGARFVLIKRTDTTGDWYVWDTERGIVGGNDPYLLLNSSAAEVTNTDYIDTYSAGFELSSTAPAALNASGGSYIFLAIA